MGTQRAAAGIPPLVEQAMALSRKMRFELSCEIEVGRLLHVLAGQFRRGVIGEIGTGCGVGSAWIASALAPEASFVTVEIDRERAAAAEALFAHLPNVQVLQGDWHDILAHGPFMMMFPDGGRAKAREPATVLSALAPGGIVVLDDLTPVEHASEWRENPDPVRRFWLNDPRLRATEVRVTAATAVIVATRV